MTRLHWGTQVPLETEDDFYFASSLPSSFTGLPFLVWISPKGYARHDVRVKVSRSHQVKRGEFITVSVRPEVKVLRGELTSTELELLREWIDLNREVLVRFWEGDIQDTLDVLAKLRSLEKGNGKP
jgi:hypothetical protein